MNTVSRLLSALVLSATFIAAPLAASAEEANAPAADHGKKGERRAHGDKQKPSFPMKAEEFRKRVDHRIEKVKARVERALDKHKVPAARRGEVNKALEGAEKEVRGAVDKAVTDGVVTKDEAKQVRDLAKRLRESAGAFLKGKHGGHKGGKGHHDKKGADV
jgi:Ni/Co efflux regulator RcnB